MKNVFFIASASPVISGRFVISCWAFSLWMWGKLFNIAWNSFHLQTSPETFHTANLSRAWDLLEDDFSLVDLLTDFLPEAEEIVAVQTLLEVMHIRSEFAMWVSLLSFLRGSFLEPDLSSWMEEMQKCTPCPKDARTHLLLYYSHLFLCNVPRKLVAECGCKQMCKQLRVPAIFYSKRYESAVLLSMCKSVVIFDCLFVKVRIANFVAINSRTSICKFSSFSDYFPPVDTPLQKTSQPDFDASVCIYKFGSFCLSDFPVFNLIFSTHQRSSSFFNTISAWYEQAWFSNCICCCCCKYFSCRPISFVNSETVVWEWERSVWHFKITFSIFSSVSVKVIVQVSIFRPKNSISWDGFRTAFFRFMTKPSFSLKFPLCFASEEYRQVISLDECSTASTELLIPSMVLEISWEQALNQKKVRETRKDFQTNLSFWDACME